MLVAFPASNFRMSCSRSVIHINEAANSTPMQRKHNNSYSIPYIYIVVLFWPLNTLSSYAGDYFRSFVRIEPEKIANVFVFVAFLAQPPYPLPPPQNDDLFASHVVDFHLPLCSCTFPCPLTVGGLLCLPH